MAQQEARTSQKRVAITCSCANCKIDLDPDPVHARRGQTVAWTCNGGGCDRFVIEFEPAGPIVPRVMHANCGEAAVGFVRPGVAKGEYKYSVYTFCGDEVCERDPELIVDD
jgi:hypothetical protein